MPGHVCHDLAGAHFSVKRHPARPAGAPLATRAVRALFLSMPGKREIEDVADIEQPTQKYLKQLAAAESAAKKGMKNTIPNPTAQTPAAPEAETIASTGEASAAAGLGSAGDLAAAQGHACPPSRPAEGAATQDVATYFQTLAAWVHNAVAEAVKTKAPGLRRADVADTLPYQFKALPIQEQCGDEQSSSYKAPWNPGDAQTAMNTAGRYEAGGNAMWLSVCPQDAKQRILAGNSASMQDIDDEAQFFTVTMWSATSEEGEARTWERLIFPDVLPVGVRDKAVLYG